jgi:hypothetical protein
MAGHSFAEEVEGFGILEEGEALEWLDILDMYCDRRSNRPLGLVVPFLRGTTPGYQGSSISRDALLTSSKRGNAHNGKAPRNKNKDEGEGYPAHRERETGRETTTGTIEMEALSLRPFVFGFLSEHGSWTMQNPISMAAGHHAFGARWS